jgi:uncharacterized membrane protein YgcG
MAAQVNFALAPGRANNLVIDYTTSEGIKLYGKAVSPLDPQYDLKSEGLFAFLQKVRNRSIEQQWDDILNIEVPLAIPIQGQPAPRYNLVTQYGRMTKANVDTSARTYAFAESRDAQNSHQLFQFLYRSMDDAAQARLGVQESDFLIHEPADPTTLIFNGPLYLKTIIGLAHIDTRATAAHIRQSLAKLPAKLAELNFDITEFNTYVKVQRGALMARGEESTDLLVNLFDALASVPDVPFTQYVDRIKDEYDESDPKVTVDYLMNRCELKCKVLQRSGKYNVPSKEEEKIIALSTEVDRMKAASSALQAKLASKKEDRAGRGGGRGGGGGGGRGGRGEGGGGRGGRGRANTGAWAWKDIPPADGAPKTKVVESKTYHWCPKHAAWCIHLPADCRMEDADVEAPDAQALAAEAIMDDQGSIFHDLE